jgi:hypothetical protein
MYSLGAMMLAPAIEIWFAIVASCIATLCMAILAGRGQHIWQVLPLLAVEFLLMGAALVLWMFEVWFVAKSLIAIGMSASIALLLGIVIGVALVVAAIGACRAVVRAGYAVAGVRTPYASDVANSLWFGRAGTWRPRDFSKP